MWCRNRSGRAGPQDTGPLLCPTVGPMALGDSWEYFHPHQCTVPPLAPHQGVWHRPKWEAEAEELSQGPMKGQQQTHSPGLSQEWWPLLTRLLRQPTPSQACVLRII